MKIKIFIKCMMNKLDLKKNPEEYYKQFSNYVEPLYDTYVFTKELKNVTKELKKLGVDFYFIKWGTYPNPVFEYESWTEENQGKIVNCILYSEDKLFWDARNKDGIMLLSHKINVKLRTSVNNVFKKYFPNQTLGITNDKDNLKIYFLKQNSIKKDKKKISFELMVHFKNTKLNDYTIKYFDKLISNDIGYIDEYDMMIKNGVVYMDLNIGNVTKFKTIIDHLENNKLDFPLIKKIKLTRLD